MSNYIALSTDINKKHLIGNKASRLVDLIEVGINVPSFFVVTTYAFDAFLLQNNLQEIMRDIKGKFSSYDIDEVRKAYDTIESHILAAPIPEMLVNDIMAALKNLQSDNSACAVRSSANTEDTHKHSFAGLYRSYMNISDPESIIEAIKRCWASLWTPESLYSRNLLGEKAHSAKMAVIIQRFIPSSVSGVIFSDGDYLNHPGCLVINAVPGLGEGLVSGLVPADLYAIQRSNSFEISQVLAGKNSIVVPSNTSGTVLNDINYSDTMNPVLCEEHIRNLTDVALKIEGTFESPQDIEWAIYDDKIYIMQSRPIVNTVRDKDTSDIINGIYEAIQGRDALAYWKISNNLGRIPLSPFAQDVWAISARGRERASEILALPAINTWGIFNGYIYLGQRPVKEKETLNELPRTERWRAACDMLADKWEDEFRSEVEGNNALLEKFDFHSATPHDLLGHLRFSLTIWERHWEIHDLVMDSKKFVLDKFLSMFQQIFGYERWRDALRLFQGFENINTRINADIWKLAYEASQCEEIVRCLAADDSTSCISQLYTSKSASTFIDMMSSFLTQWGSRIVGPNDFLHSSIREDPAFLITVLLWFVQSDRPNPNIELEKLASDREETEKHILNELPLHDEQRCHFIKAMYRAQTWSVFLEDHNYLIENSLVAYIRRIALALGQALEKMSIIDDSNDIFFIRIDDIENVVRESVAVDLRNIIKENKNAYKMRIGVPVPQTIGTPLVMADQLLYGKGATKIDYFNLDFFPDPLSMMPYKLLGIPAAHGYARGVARIIHDIDEFAQVQLGDILVCQRTTPAWTPLFSLIAGIVTNAGSGLLQHSAINAREFGIPAVIGTQVATDIIRSGQVIVIDGTQGEILLNPDGLS